MAWKHVCIVLAIAAAGPVALTFLLVIIQARAQHKFQGSIDSVGVNPKGGLVNRTLALFKSILSLQETVRDGYERFSKKDKPFLLPTMWVGGSVVVLPPSKLHLLNKPREELSSTGALLDNAQFQYLMTDKDVWGNTIHFDIVRKDLGPKDMGPLAGIIGAEWESAFRKNWGESETGTTVKAWDSMVNIIAHPALRLMVGEPWCRDSKYQELSMIYANSVLVDACFINCLPPWVRPVVGRMFAVRARIYQRKLLKVLIPMVEERLRQYEENDGIGEGPGDVIMWLIRIAKTHGPEQLQPEKIASRILALTSMFVFGIGWIFAHAVLDLYGSPDRDDFIPTLEAESRRVLAEHGTFSTKEAVDSLHHLDSAIRESMRLSDVMVHLLPLDVIAGEGIDLDEGRHIAQGSKIRTVFPAQMIHTDPDYYPNPHHFDAFRFSRAFDESLQSGVPQSKKREPMTTVSTSFLPFGYGRHACPGRWLVAHMVKQAMAHILVEYDVEITKKPGKRISILNLMLPPQGAEMKVTRKKQGKSASG